MTTSSTPATEAVRVTEAFYATRPTKTTIFLRTFVPWQLWRFAVINLKMLRIIARSHRTH
jgi:hypothetical protein